MDCSLPSSSVSRIFQARIVEWVAIFFSGDLPDPGVDPVSPALSGGFFTIWVTRKAHHKIYDPSNKGQKDERSKLITYGIIDDLYILFLFLNFFWCGPFLKPLLNLLQRSFCFCFCFFFVCLFLSCEACGILAPRPGIRLTLPALEGKVLTTRPPGKSLTELFWLYRANSKHCELA